MPRQKRVLSPTQIYHIMVRGNSGRDIFIEDEDRQKLLKIIINKNREKEFNIYAYCLMDNHFHLVLKEQKNNVSHIMKKINTTYAIYFNKKYQLNGHLFQDRFKSEIVESDDYFLAVIRYIHNNPVKAGLVSLPQEYKWNSYSWYVKPNSNSNKIVNVEDPLRLFSDDLSQARSRFIEFSQLREEKYKFLEYKDNDKSKKELDTDLKIKYFRDQFLRRNKITLDCLSDRRNKVLRDKLIQELQEKSIYSNREIAEFLKMGRGMVESAGRRK